MFLKNFSLRIKFKTEGCDSRIEIKLGVVSPLSVWLKVYSHYFST